MEDLETVLHFPPARKLPNSIGHSFLADAPVSVLTAFPTCDSRTSQVHRTSSSHDTLKSLHLKQPISCQHDHTVTNSAEAHMYTCFELLDKTNPNLFVITFLSSARTANSEFHKLKLSNFLVLLW